MAFEESLRTITLNADSSAAGYTGVPGLPGSADPNSGKQYRFVKVTGAVQCGLADQTANEKVVGVMQNKPQKAGDPATVAIAGISFVQVGTGGLTAGNQVKPASDGTGIAATAGTDDGVTVGIAITTASAGQLASVLITTQG